MSSTDDLLEQLNNSFNNINTLVIEEMNMFVDVKLYEDVISYFDDNSNFDLDLSK